MEITKAIDKRMGKLFTDISPTMQKWFSGKAKVSSQEAEITYLQLKICQLEEKLDKNIKYHEYLSEKISHLHTIIKSGTINKRGEEPLEMD